MVKLMVAHVGDPRSGKSSGQEHLVDLDFTPVTISDLLQEFCREKGIDLTDRHSYSSAFTLMRKEIDVADLVLERSGNLTSMDGNRVPAIEDKLRQKLGSAFISIAYEAPLEVRYQRYLLDPKKSTATNKYEFAMDEAPEYRNPGVDLDPEQNNVHYLMDMADYKIDASGPIEEVHAQLDAIIVPRLEIVGS